MKKFLGILVLGLLVCSTGNAAKYGKGELKLSPSIVDYFIQYIRGKGKQFPSGFYVSLDGNSAIYWICSQGPATCMEGDAVQDILHCERKTGKKCKKFARKRVIKWKNGINKATKINSKWSDNQIEAKLTEIGFYGQSSTKKSTTTKKIEKKKKTSQTDDTRDIVQQLQDLSALYDSGALTKEEFEKAKKEILN